ncbi:MAG: hypothetical protein P8Z41_17120 [Anaerolineales bacterium]
MNSTPSAYNELDSPGWGEIAIQFIQWFVRGLVQPVYSLPFYRSGLKKGLGWAIMGSRPWMERSPGSSVISARLSVLT